MFFLRYYKNKKMILQHCLNYTLHWTGLSSSDKFTLMFTRCLNRYMDINHDVIAAQDASDPDYQVFIYRMLSAVSFDMLTSKAFSYRHDLKIVHKNSLDSLLNPGYISQHEYDEEMTQLHTLLEERLSQDERDYIQHKRSFEKKLIGVNNEDNL